MLDDWVRIEHWDCSPMAGFPMDVCAQPLRPVAGPEPEPGIEKDPAEVLDPPVAEPAKRIVVVGDSHAQQLSGALLPIAERNNWQLIAIIRGACPFSTASETDPDDADCLAWNIAAADEISALHPDAVVTLASRNVRAGLTEQTPAGFVDQWRRLDAEGIPVLALRDNPRFDASMPDCVLVHPDDPGVCATDRAALYAPVPPWTEIPDLPANVAFVDIADAVCDVERCPPVIGNVLVYMDDNHVTATYSTSMSDLIADQVHAGLAGSPPRESPE
ncbi:hypothetical protein BJF78_30775 [Pseudonocardia sp. CNS-139]|nr:hypothetical protein BJF78_30775 [Pseudonocardia sp. CNS-139]